MPLQPADLLILGFCKVSPLDLLDILPAGWVIHHYQLSQSLVKIKDEAGRIVTCVFSPRKDLLPKGAICADVDTANLAVKLAQYLSEEDPTTAEDPNEQVNGTAKPAEIS